MFKKRASAYLVGALFLSILFSIPSLSHAAVTSGAIFSLTASPSKVSGTSWTNDGTAGGSATLYPLTGSTPTYSAADTSVAINAVANQSQYIEGIGSSMSGIDTITAEFVLKIPSTQANGSSGMIMGWAGSFYSLWMNAGGIGFNTGSGDVYGVSLSGYYDAYHTYTFVMSKNQSDAAQRLYIDGARVNSLSFQGGGSANQASKTFGTLNKFEIGTYGTNGNFWGTYNIRNFRLYYRELTSPEVLNNYNAAYVPTSIDLALTSGLNTAVYRTQSVIRATVDVDGKVAFYLRGKRIPGCQSIQSSGGVADCKWPPASRGLQSITAVVTANGSSKSSAPLLVTIGNRPGKR
jgi:hypothetical protein